MVDRDAAQAATLIRALCDLRNKMIGQMIWLEKHDAKLGAAALQRDINEAQPHITRLQHRYLVGEVGASQSPPAVGQDLEPLARRAK